VTTQDVATKAVLFFKYFISAERGLENAPGGTRAEESQHSPTEESTIESRPRESPVGLDWELNLRVRAHERAATNEQSTETENVQILIRPVPQRKDLRSGTSTLARQHTII
jgi:hypothetical protein